MKKTAKPKWFVRAIRSNTGCHGICGLELQFRWNSLADMADEVAEAIRSGRKPGSVDYYRKKAEALRSVTGSTAVVGGASDWTRAEFTVRFQANDGSEPSEWYGASIEAGDIHPLVARAIGKLAKDHDPHRMSPNEAIACLRAQPCDVVQLGDGLSSEFVPIESCDVESPKDVAGKAEQAA